VAVNLAFELSVIQLQLERGAGGAADQEKLGERRIVAKLVEQLGLDAPNEFALPRAAIDGVRRLGAP
jgi:hypothetical protein